MQLRFNKPMSFFHKWAEDSAGKSVILSNLQFHSYGDLTIVSGPASYFIHFLSELSGSYDLDDIIQDPIIS